MIRSTQFFIVELRPDFWRRVSYPMTDLEIRVAFDPKPQATAFRAS